MDIEYLKGMGEDFLDKRAERVADAWAGAYSLDWQRVIKKFSGKTGVDEATAVQFLRMATESQRFQVDIDHEADWKLHVREVERINEEIRQTNKETLAVVRDVAPILRRLSRPWWKRLFA